MGYFGGCRVRIIFITVGSRVFFSSCVRGLASLAYSKLFILYRDIMGVVLIGFLGVGRFVVSVLIPTRMCLGTDFYLLEASEVAFIQPSSAISQEDTTNNYL